MHIKRPYLTAFLCAIVGCLCTVAFFFMLYGQNGLRLEHDGTVETLRWPHAYSFSEGDTVEIPNEDGTSYRATVVDVITIPTEPIDDEPLQP